MKVRYRVREWGWSLKQGELEYIVKVSQEETGRINGGREEVGKRGNTGGTDKGHLMGRMETCYNKSFLKYIHLWKKSKWPLPTLQDGVEQESKRFVCSGNLWLQWSCTTSNTTAAQILRRDQETSSYMRAVSLISHLLQLSTECTKGLLTALQGVGERAGFLFCKCWEQSTYFWEILVLL